MVHYGIKKIYAIIHICNEDGKFMKNQQEFHWIEIKLIFFFSHDVEQFIKYIIYSLIFIFISDIMKAFFCKE